MKILIVDDELLIRKSLLRVFTSLGHSCDEAINGVDAIKKINEFNFDVVVLDVIMPEKSGYEVLLEVKKNVPFFIISAFTGDNTIVGYIQSDPRVLDYIKKPFENVFEVANLMLEKLK